MPRETIVPRFYGSEIEYSWRRKSGASDMIDKQFPPGVKHMGEYLENGGRMYMDIGFHPEYATPECKTLDELVTHELAGERLIWDAYKNSVEKFHKRCILPFEDITKIGSKTLGAHENYSTSVDIWSDLNSEVDANRASLGSYLATRTVFVGAGHITKRGFVLGQKTEDINQEINTTTTSFNNKPLINTRYEHHSGSGELYRLHVISGDANMSPWALRMKFGTTSLMLRLLEHNVDVSDLNLRNLIPAVHIVAENEQGMSTPLTLAHSRESFTALDIQEEYARRSHELSQRIELPQEELQVIDDWFTIIDALRAYRATGDSPSILEQVDWFTKKKRLELMREKRQDRLKTQEEEYFIDMAYDLRYDEIPNGTGVQLRKTRYAPYTPSDEKIEDAKINPPEGRAKLRGTLIKEVYARRRFQPQAICWDGFFPEGITKKKMPLEADYSDEAISERVEEWFSLAPLRNPES